MLTYQDVVTIRLGPLTTAATSWDEMAQGFDELGAAYGRSVQSVTTDGEWVGESADAAEARFKGTRKQFDSAAVEARAIASILRDIHAQFTERIHAVNKLVESAKEADIHIDTKGEAHLDTSKHKDPKGGGFVDETARFVLEARWTAAVARAVQAVDDADEGAKLALRDAAGIKGLFENIANGIVGGGHDFNGDAVGDIEVVEAREAKKYADQILAGGKPSDPEEYARLMRDNSGDKAFSQTYLDLLGPDKALRLANKIDDLAYFDDTKHKSAYLQINGGLADSLATATHVPDFKDAHGKHLRFGTEAYNQAFGDWSKTDDARFYNKWRAGLREHGDDAYDFKAAGEKRHLAKGEGQQIRGYQSLATLMQQGSSAYSPQFVADVTDDMIAMEKKNPDIWDLYGEFTGEHQEGWFANDPVDGALGVMSRDPEGAAGYLDPGTSAGKERFDYLVGDGDGSRDWDVTNTTSWKGHGGNIEVDAGDVEDADGRKGLGDALTAAATGVDPNGSAPEKPTTHTDANDRIFERALKTFSGQGDDMHASLRDDMAKIMTNHGSDVFVAMHDQSGTEGSLDQEQVMEVTKQISRSEESYGMLHEGMNHAIVAGFHEKGSRPEDTLDAAGHAVGFMEEARYNALKGDKHDYTWDKTWSYHASGAVLNFIPVYGDLAQRGADVVTTAWILDEQKRQDAEITSDNQATYKSRQNQLNALAEQWYSVNSEWADGETGYSKQSGIFNKIYAAANDGNSKADGLAGDQ
ncbi:hypothetical protein ACGFRB_19575 [Streptomyces sp. NPDC048718]|uniref:PPE domain-containing protein n=1 Tax=Streptomyces sp. NPDC048718 TaxID=3365587 RepID=UPI00371B1D7D